MIYRREFDQAIAQLESIDDHSLSSRDLAQKHLELGIAHHKLRNIDKSNYHYRIAIQHHHPTGYAHEHLAINLTKQGKLEEAIEVCLHLIEHRGIPSHGSYLSKEDMKKRMEKLIKRLERSKAQGKKHATPDERPAQRETP